MATYANIVTAFQTTFPDCDTATANILLNDVDEEILGVIPYRKSVVYQGFTNNVGSYDADETIIKVFAASLVNPDGTLQELWQSSTTNEDFLNTGWRGLQSSTQPFNFLCDQSMTAGQFRVVPPPNYSTLIVSATTNASPPQITTTTAHGFSSNAGVATQVEIQNTTLAGLSGSFYAKYVSPTAFTLYTDSALTIPVGAPGSTASAGLVGTRANQFLRLDCCQRLASLTSSSAMSLTPTIRRLYASGMRWAWALYKHWDMQAELRAQFENDLGIAQQMFEKRAANVNPALKTFRQSMNFRRGGRGSGRAWTYLGNQNWS